MPIITDPQTLESLYQGGSIALDQFLIKEISTFRRMYGIGENPSVIYKGLHSIVVWAKQFPAHRKSYQFGRLEAMTGEMLISQGQNKMMLERAITHFESAIYVIKHVEPFDDAVLRSYVGVGLLLGVAHKAIGNYEESVKVMDKIADELLKKHKKTELDLISLRRQKVIMEQTVSGHRTMAEDAIRYATLCPKEYFRSLKRVFEFVLNRGGLREADAIFSEFRRAFAVVANQMEPLSHVSFLKNVGQYAIMRNELEAAKSVLEQAKTSAKALGFHGQIRQIQIMEDDISSNNIDAKLITFSVSMR